MLRTNRASPLKASLRYLSTVQTTSFDPKSLDVKPNASIYSAIQPTGKFHLGNYLGAVRVWRDLCDIAPESTRIVYGVADLHAITVPKGRKELKDLRYEAIASILSTGIDHDRAIVYHQSALSEHAELNWILSCLTGVGYLGRMTQWKSKSEGSESASLGLFAYPVLQAADILLFKSTQVPVGDDQSQHLELCRHIAQQFNKSYKKTFPLPTTILAPTKRILSLKNPTKKMSKSDSDQAATLYMTEEPDAIAKKIKKAVTDSISYEFKYDPENRPGVSNMINLVSGIQRKSIEQVERDIAHLDDHKKFKDYVTEVIVEEFRGPREEYNRLMGDQSYLHEVVKKGNDRARAIAEKTMNEVKVNAGFD
ncbi:CYFA0S07e04500g1_1 [Cyberlindnera fabianii]|uniref:Tryptophan--tRNA ligase, mitochondrial n=1 Tax=Cyberlindnera fabianii TaxID=36022 RepID=A0A061AVI2_CYBFA|nr:CYFA0S07e04500g1_1 [Cyberlindnera fabianii]